jgi:hypothetical protein
VRLAPCHRRLGRLERGGRLGVALEGPDRPAFRGAPTAAHLTPTFVGDARGSGLPSRDYACRMNVALRFLAAISLGLIAALAQASEAGAEKRIALVVGNARYATAPLNNPEIDARTVATALTKLGFDVTTHVNLGVREFRRVLREYSKRLQNDGTVAVFYYAGHGVQIDGKNYLLPVDLNLRDEDEVKDDGVDIDELFVSRLERVRAHTRIVILDACRDNPFGKKTRTVRSISGLAEMDANGALIAFSSAPGKVAEDGPAGTNSAFTKHLAREMLVEGIEVEQMLKNVRMGVLRDTQQRQTPWHTSSLTRNFYFNPKPKAGDDPRMADEVARLRAALDAANGRIDVLTRDREKPAPAAASTRPDAKPAAPAPTPAAPKEKPAPKPATEPRVAEAKPPPARSERSEKCVDLLTRAQLGEPLSAADVALMQKECR